MESREISAHKKKYMYISFSNHWVKLKVELELWKIYTNVGKSKNESIPDIQCKLQYKIVSETNYTCHICKLQCERKKKKVVSTTTNASRYRLRYTRL